MWGRPLNFFGGDGCRDRPLYFFGVMMIWRGRQLDVYGRMRVKMKHETSIGYKIQLDNDRKGQTIVDMV